MRLLAAILVGAALAVGCTFAPPGECAATADCEAGLTCSGGVCVGCSGDAACGGWQACSATRRCVSRPGFCSADAECATWEACGDAHTCLVKAGECGSGADCGAWESCTANRCQPLPGRCSAQADCPWYQACTAAHVCGRPVFDPAAVAMWGTLDPAVCGRRAVAPVDHPEQARIGFDCDGPAAPAAVSPQGDLYYTSVAGVLRGVSRFEPDAAIWSSGWNLPGAPLLNDPVVVAPGACAGGGVDHWLLQAGSGDVLYACASAGGFDYFDAAGASRFSGPRVLAWTAGNAVLTAAAGGFQVVLSDGTAVPVAGLGASIAVAAARAHGEAFWLVDAAGFGAPRRYSAGTGGQAVFDGTYAPLPAGVVMDAPADGTALLDGAGVLWQRGSDGSGAVVVRRPLAPAAASVAYREADMPAGANDLGKQAFVPFVRLGAGPLVTGP